MSIVYGDGFELEGVPLVPIEVGHTDTDATTMLHVPTTELLVAGDVVYNGVHLYPPNQVAYRALTRGWTRSISPKGCDRRQ